MSVSRPFGSAGFAAKKESRSTLAAALLDVSPRLVATFKVGTDIRPALVWLDRNTVAYAATKGFGGIRTIDAVAPREVPAPAFSMPELTGKTDGNPAGIVVMHALSPERMMAVYSEGTRSDPAAG